MKNSIALLSSVLILAAAGIPGARDIQIINFQKKDKITIGASAVPPNRSC